MKRIWIISIVLVLLLGCVGCSQAPVESTVESTVELESCAYCGAGVGAEDNYCSNCGEPNDGGASLEVDYSGFSLDNMFGMTEWIRIEDFELTDHSNAYVEAGDHYYVINFANGYIEVRSFNSNYRQEYTGHFYGDRTEGALRDTHPYRLVSGYVMEFQLTNKRNAEITDVQIVEGIPIIFVDSSEPAADIDGCYIPTDFIDWTREPVTAGDLSPIMYYVSEEYLK